MGSHQMAIALLGSVVWIASACTPAAIPERATTAAEVTRRPERLTTGAAGLAAPMGPARAGVVLDVPVRDAVVIAVPVPAVVEAAEEPDTASVAVPAPPPAGTVVVPERVELAEDDAVVAPVTPRSPRRRGLRASSSLGAPVFTSPSIFTPTGP